MALDASVRITDYAEARIGTSLGPRLLAEARQAASESDAAAASGDHNRQLQKCLVAILCAHAAVEAQMNEVGDQLDPTWWATHEGKRMGEKWRLLIERHAGTKPKRSDPVYKSVLRLSADRNGVAHHRGLRQSDGTSERSGPPIETKGGISPIRAHYDFDRARAAVVDAESAFRAL